MKRPERIRVLGKRYAVHYVPAGHEGLKDGPDDDEPGTGRSDSDKQVVYIEDGQPLENEQDTVLHELFHLVEANLDLDLGEDVVVCLTTALLAIIKDNPKFVRYIAAKAK